MHARVIHLGETPYADALALQRELAAAVKEGTAPDTVIFGADSPLDSIGFVTFVTDMEDRLSAATGKEISITLLDIDDFNESDPHLTVKRLADFLVRLSSA